MNIEEIPVKFKTLEQANKFWKNFQDEKIQKQMQIIDQINLKKQLEKIHDEEQRMFFKNVFLATLERY